MREILVCRRRLFGLAALGLGAIAAGLIGSPAAARVGRKGMHRSRRLPTVVLDPGHGGSDPGAIGSDGIYEKEITLATARRLRLQLARTRRFRVLMTRNADEFVGLRRRVAFARAHRADLFLSIHADDLANAALRGASVYTLSAQASDRETAALARRENRGERLGGLHLRREPRDVGTVLLDLLRVEIHNLSVLFARDLVDCLARAVALLERPLRSADFVVLSAPDIPSALVELGCLSNAVEDRRLEQKAYQARLAEALFSAIERYFDRRTLV
jgi:N-acetylmuramoyl-L-alanine amidase